MNINDNQKFVRKIKYATSGKWANALLTVVLMAWVGNVVAAPKLQGNLEALLVVADENGKESFRAAEAVLPGQVIEYRLLYSNEGDEVINNLKVLGPIPEEVEYVAMSASSASNAELEASIDMGITWSSEPLYRTALDANGKEIQEIVPPSQYHQIRWSSFDELKPDDSFQYTYRVRVKGSLDL